MSLYRYSPIQSKEQLQEVIGYLHTASHELCFQVLGRYLSVSGNIGIFCHYEEEFQYLTKLSQDLTRDTNYNQKYFELKQPIVVPPLGNIPGATYEFLYIRKPDPYRSQVGDIDFVLEVDEHDKLKANLSTDKFVRSARIFGRTEENMIELWDPDKDVLGYIVNENMRSKL